MNHPIPFLSYILIASLPVFASNPAWSKPVEQDGVAEVSSKKAASKPRKARVATKKAQPAPIPDKVAATADSPPTATSTDDQHLAAAPAPVANPYMASGQQSAPTAASANPYLAYQQQTAAPVAQASLSTAKAPTNAYHAAPPSFEPVNPWNSFGQVVDNVKHALPSLPGGDRSILPKIKTVYPTGEKPLVVLTFKCPTELIGVTPPPVMLLREGINLAMDGINRSDLLSFNMQQVCQ